MAFMGNQRRRRRRVLEIAIGIVVFCVFAASLQGRKKRNVSSYDVGGGISHREVEEMIGIARTLQQDVEQWIRTNHSSLL
jgi:hypothetical protein